MEVTIPNNYTPRHYQKEIFEYFHNGGDRGVAVWHRRAGKDTTALHLMATMMMGRVGNYWHLMPIQTQARKAIWRGINKDGKKILEEVFPLSIRKRTLEAEMIIELKNGSTYQLCGSDNYDSLVGSNPVGTIFSEYPLTDPAAWSFIRPILLENDGWAFFIYTPRGRNHGYKLMKQAKVNQRWMLSLKTVHDTNVLSESALKEEKIEMDDEDYKQEYLCDFDAAVRGAIYDKQIRKMREDGRITSVPYMPNCPVKVIFDLGKADSTSMIFVQTVSGQHRLIDYYENTGEEVSHYAKICQDRPYVYAEIPFILPHDATHTKLGQEFSVADQFEELGFKSEVLPIDGIANGISAARTFLATCWVDEKRCDRLIDCLSNYSYKWNDKLQILSKDPLHNWASHGADAMRYLATGYIAEAQRDVNAEARHDEDINNYDPLGDYY